MIEFLSESTIRGALDELLSVLEQSNIEGSRVCIVGGAAVLFQCYERNSTVDIDAFLDPEREILSAAQTVAERLGLPKDWLNSAAAQFLPSSFEGRGAEWQLAKEGQGGNSVYFGSPNMLLAMKTKSLIKRARRDSEDFLNLAVQADIGTLEGIIENFEEYYPDDDIPDPTRAIISSLLSQTTTINPRGSIGL